MIIAMGDQNTANDAVLTENFSYSSTLQSIDLATVKLIWFTIGHGDYEEKIKIGFHLRCQNHQGVKMMRTKMNPEAQKSGEKAF